MLNSKPSPKKFLPTNIPGLSKNIKTKVVINDNTGDYMRLLAARQKKKEDNILKQEVASLKDELAKLNMMIKDLIKERIV